MKTVTIRIIKTLKYSVTSAIIVNDEIIGYITRGSGEHKTCFKAGGLQRDAGKRYWITDQDGICRVKLQDFTEFGTRKAAIAKLIK
jgi:hypothetical protein